MVGFAAMPPIPERLRAAPACVPPEEPRGSAPRSVAAEAQLRLSSSAKENAAISESHVREL